MLDARMYAPAEKGITPPSAYTDPLDAIKSGPLLGPDEADERVLARSRRSALMTYYSKEVELMQKMTRIHWYFLGWRKEAETLTVDLFEGVEFAKGWRNVPSTMRVEVQTPRRQQMQIYDARVVFRARFGGLRWLMYNHRIISGVFFITTFWATEMVFASAAWLVLSWIIFGGEDDEAEGQRQRQRIKREDGTVTSIKDEEEEEEEEGEHMSETERTFPTYGHQPPLRYRNSASAASLKKEDPSRDEEEDLLAQIPVLAAQDADIEDEDEDADFFLDTAGTTWRDSGLGTSMESSGPATGPAVRRRRSKHSSSSAEVAARLL